MTDQPPADGRAPAPGARSALTIDIPLPPARPAVGRGRAGTDAPVSRPPGPEAPGARPPAVSPAPVVRPSPTVRPAPDRPTASRAPAPGLSYEAPTIEWRAIKPRPVARHRPVRPARPAPVGRHLAVVGVGAAGLGLAGWLAGLLSSTLPFVFLGWGASGTIVLLVVVRIGRRIGDAIGGGSK
jgi:hypothetical protein